MTEIQELQTKIDREDATNKRLDKKLATIQKEIIESKRKQSAGVGSVRQGNNLDRDRELSRQLKIIENRLDKANKKFSEALLTNKQLRDQIDELRRERVLFEQMYGKIEKQLGIKRKDIAKMVDIVSKHNDDRDQLICQI